METTEKKTYLVNVESNLEKYAQEAADAKKKVDDLEKANQDLKESGQIKLRIGLTYNVIYIYQ